MALIISQRKEMYAQAHENAKAEGASSKVRRLERGMKVRSPSVVSKDVSVSPHSRETDILETVDKKIQ